ncbi:MAG TPA: ABC transporter ATP-binding protein, partial [Polyangiaceae bacterium]|nr:ABC transporter ATP-binding protein [Polyangiaceae bacterium]
RVEIDGIDVSVDPERVRRIIGYMADHAGVYERITVREFLEFYADAYAVPDAGVVDAVIELTDLKKLEDRLVVTLSKGNKQRLQVARILLHDPKVLILDEPASDLDPRARIEVRDLLLELRDLGKTIFLSSHILTELSDVCTSVGILERGKLIVAGPIGEIAERLAGAAGENQNAQAGSEAVGTTAGGAAVPDSTRRRLKLRVLGDSRTVAPLLSGGAGVLGVEAGPGGQILMSYVGDDRFVAEVVRHLVASGVGIVSVEPERNELERIFLEVTRGELS